MTAETGPSTSAVFEVLGHETRLAIIEELAKHQRARWQASGLGFTELRAAVGVEDAGKFNYHLGKLTDHFVEKRGDEYVIRSTGLELAGAILAGTYTQHADTRRSEIDRGCPACDAPLEAIYESGHLRVECPDHGHIFDSMIPPGAAAGRSMDELLAVATREMRHVAEHARGGICSDCWGELHTTVPADPPPLVRERAEDDSGVDATTEDVLVRFSCKRCETALLKMDDGAGIESVPRGVAKDISVSSYRTICRCYRNFVSQISNCGYPTPVLTGKSTARAAFRECYH